MSTPTLTQVPDLSSASDRPQASTLPLAPDALVHLVQLLLNPDEIARNLRLVFTPEEAATVLRLGRTTVYGLLASGELKSGKVGNLRRISLADLQDYIDTHITQAA